jgi:hypothetical protein
MWCLLHLIFISIRWYYAELVTTRLWTHINFFVFFPTRFTQLGPYQPGPRFRNRFVSNLRKKGGIEINETRVNLGL